MMEISENNYYKVLLDEKSINIKNKKSGVVIIPITNKNEVLIIESYRKNIYKNVFELPRGFCEDGETYIESAIRELKEETNCDAKRFLELGEIYPDSGLTDSCIKLVLADEISIENIKLEEKERIISYKLLDIYKVKELINNYEINDAFTIAGIFRGINYLQSIGRV